MVLTVVLVTIVHQKKRKGGSSITSLHHFIFTLPHPPENLSLDNLLGAPANVDPEVRAAQYLGIFVVLLIVDRGRRKVVGR